MEFWDIYDKDKKPTGRTMKKNDWILKDGEYHLSVLGVIHRPDGRFLITQRVMTKAWAPTRCPCLCHHTACHDKGMGTGLVGGFRRSCTGR